jgi:hypothetical protein
LSTFDDMQLIPGDGVMPSPGDIRDAIRADHAQFLAELEKLAAEADGSRRLGQISRVQRLWVVHAIAEETVVYKVLEGGETGSDAEGRFEDHDLVKSHLARLSRYRPGSSAWRVRLDMARDVVVRHIESEQRDVFARLEQKFDSQGLREIGERFALARHKLTVLEEAKRLSRVPHPEVSATTPAPA